MYKLKENHVTFSDQKIDRYIRHVQLKKNGTIREVLKFQKSESIIFFFMMVQNSMFLINISKVRT